MIHRARHELRVRELLGQDPVCALLGARQVGKTTLARTLGQAWSGPVHAFDLELPADRARLSDPWLALDPLRGLVVLDEAQFAPELFPVLRVLADRPGTPARFLLLGSASPRLTKGVSESLAGRISFHELSGFALEEVGRDEHIRLWTRGGFPRSYVADSDMASADWRRAFIRTFLERDLPQYGIDIPAQTLRRFWTMLAHYHGQIWNASELGRAFGLSHHAVNRYLDILSATFVVRRLSPWHENLAKRQVKAPKVYIADSGLVHTLLNLETRDDIEGHPKCGATWEGFALDAVVTRLGARPDECYFWATHAGAELDLLVVRGNRRLGFEFKRSSAPRTTRSMHTARRDLKLDELTVVHAGQHDFPLAEGIRALALENVPDGLTPL
jgi:uncharacterized protein